MLIFAITLLATFPWIHAQESEDFGPQQFEWGFNNSVSTSLPFCEKFVLEVDSRRSSGVPPYYMMAFAIGGMPITSFIGTNESDLTWTVNNPVGTQLVLGVVDSEGHTGGIAPTLYTVTEGDTTGCVRPTTSASFKITANVTDVLNTCQPWGLVIEGGMPPYTVTIAGVNSPNVTNITGGLNDSLFTYINRISPGAQTIASVSDMMGNWATGSTLVRTQGDADTSCIGEVSSSTIGPPPTSGKFSRGKKIAIIVGTTVGGLLLLTGCAFLIWCLVRQRRERHRQKLEQQRSETRTALADVVTPFVSPIPLQHDWRTGNGYFAAQPSSSNSNSGFSSPPPGAWGGPKRCLATTTEATTEGETWSNQPHGYSPVVGATGLPPPYPI